MKEGARGGLQYHRLKDESGVMLYGRMLIKHLHPDGNRLIDKLVVCGDVFRFPPGAIHQAIALTDCAYIECSNPIFNDRVHVEDRFGIAEEAGGLPSTRLEDIVQA